jgi:hypothetical protein
MVATIRSHNGEVWYFLARDEGHGFRKKSNRDHYNNAVVLFLHKHLLNSLPAAVEAAEETLPQDIETLEVAPVELPGEEPPEEPLDPVPEPPG